MPWQSGFFGFWAEDQRTVVPMEQQPFFVNDLFGLRTLAEQGRLVKHLVPGCSHRAWLHDPAVMKAHVLPVLARGADDVS